jgi:two-component system, NarL family, invasion response regulator UvrY
MLRILIVDDHAVVRNGIKHILEKENNLVYVGEAENAQEVYELTEKEQWDMVILDINLPGPNGLDVFDRLHSQYPELPILFLSMYSEDQYALRALKMGAAGYLNKQSAPRELVKAINKISNGGKYISEKTADLLAANFEKSHEKTIHDILSDREYQIFLLEASGHTITEIAKSLSLSVKTISTYNTRILKKMNFKNKSELVQYAFQNKLIE